MVFLPETRSYSNVEKTPDKPIQGHSRKQVISVLYKCHGHENQGKARAFPGSEEMEMRGLNSTRVLSQVLLPKEDSSREGPVLHGVCSLTTKHASIDVLVLVTELWLCKT